jgi:hypothetical protein
MPFIRTRMNGDALCTKPLAVNAALRTTSGIFPPLAFLSVAILFIFTLNLVMAYCLLSILTECKINAYLQNIKRWLPEISYQM